MVGGFKALEHWQETSFCNQTGPLLRLANRIYINKESPLLHCMHFTTNKPFEEWIFWKMCLIISLEFCRENYLRSLLFPNTIRRIRKKTKEGSCFKARAWPISIGRRRQRHEAEPSRRRRFFVVLPISLCLVIYTSALLLYDLISSRFVTHSQRWELEYTFSEFWRKLSGP